VVRRAGADLIARARAGDGEAFRELTAPHHRELQVHCYRVLGSFADAEDALQDTLLATWQGLGGSTEETRLAPNLAVPDRHQPVPERAARRQPPPGPGVGRARGGPARADPARRGHWLEPYPGDLPGDAAGGLPGPEARYEQTEAISLAFVTALQVLPPRQLAVLILRDVLGFRASEVAGMLDSTVESVTSALKRARATLQRRPGPGAGGEPPPVPGSPAEDAVVAKFASAAARFSAAIFGSGRRFDLVPARANGQPAFGAYLRGPAGLRHGAGLYVLTLAGDRISAMTRFDTSVLPWFGLPRSLPG
jgi:RNA polymerase sigma-70 factor (ECF subfamily)